MLLRRFTVCRRDSFSAAAAAEASLQMTSGAPPSLRARQIQRLR